MSAHTNNSTNQSEKENLRFFFFARFVFVSVSKRDGGLRKENDESPTKQEEATKTKQNEERRRGVAVCCVCLCKRNKRSQVLCSSSLSFPLFPFLPFSLSSFLPYFHLSIFSPAFLFSCCLVLAFVFFFSHVVC